MQPVNFVKRDMTAFNGHLVQIADIVCRIQSLDPALKIEMGASTQRFLVKQAEPHVTFDVRSGDLSEFKTPGKPIFDSNAAWKLYEEGESFLFHLRSEAVGSVPYKISRVTKDFTSGEVVFHSPYLDSSQPLYPLEYPLDELLFINFLSLGRGVEVHACGLVDSKGTGRLFLGQSTAGKTTMARLWEDDPGVTILSDDRIILRKMDNQIWMHGTPWHGEAGYAAPTRAALNKVYFLRKGMRNQVSPLREVESASRFFSCCFPLFYSRDAVNFTLSFLDEVVKSVPCYELSFLPDKNTVEFLFTQSA
jgi:hypothetical protein